MQINGTYISKAFLSIIAYFSPVYMMINCVLIFIFIDFITGMYASYKMHKPIISSKFRKTIEKFFFYTVSIMIAYMFQSTFMNWFNLTQIIAGFIAATELLSIYENIKKITKLDIVSIIIKNIKEQFIKN